MNVFEFVPNESVYVDEKAFHLEYLQWKNKIIN